MKEINGVVISDIHFGALPAQQLYEELRKSFLNYLVKLPELNVIFIAGDLTDKKLSMNDEHSRYLVKFKNDLINIALLKKAKIRVIKGTRNHDFNQLNLFSYLGNKKGLDYRVINTVCDEELFPGFKVLYLPEEYMEDQNEYYKDYFNNKYNLAVGHGTMEFQAFENQIIESEKPILNAPVFTSKDFKNIDKVIFGHIHNRCNYQKKYFYCGSFSRWMFGEEKPKGYIRFVYDYETDQMKVGYINNTLAKTYITLNLDDIIHDENISLEEKVKIIEEEKNKLNADYVKVKFDGNICDDSEKVLLKTYFKENTDKNIKLNFKNNKNTKKTEEENEMLKKYDFIFNNKLDLPTTISKYLEIHDDISLSSQEIQKLLYEEE